MSVTRAESVHLALQTIREAAGPSVFLIGCGCLIATGVGYIDGMRVSADTGPTWHPELPLPPSMNDGFCSSVTISCRYRNARFIRYSKNF